MKTMMVIGVITRNQLSLAIRKEIRGGIEGYYAKEFDEITVGFVQKNMPDKDCDALIEANITGKAITIDRKKGMIKALGKLLTDRGYKKISVIMSATTEDIITSPFHM